MVIVNKNNFIEQSNDLICHLPNASFVAIDEEMTGISIPPSRRPPRDETPSQQYTARLKDVPERYSIIQLGVSLFEKVEPKLTPSSVPQQQRQPVPFVANSRGYTIDDGTSAGTTLNTNTSTNTTINSSPATPLSVTTTTPAPGTNSPEWKVRRYTFYMFPDSNATREVVLNPGAISFLRSHNMSLDTWCSTGIPYVCVGNVAISNDKTIKVNNSNDTPNDQNNLNNNSKEHSASLLFPTAFEALRRIDEYTDKTMKEREEFFRSSGTSGDDGTSSNNNNDNVPSVESTLRRTIELTRVDDIAFFARSMAMIREWLDNPIVPAPATPINTGTNPAAETTPTHPQQRAPFGVTVATDNTTEAATMTPAVTPGGTNAVGNSNTSLLLPPCNAYLRRALYENIQHEYPSLITEHGGNNQIRVLRLTEDEKNRRFFKSMNDRWNTFILHRIGMWRVFAAISLATRGYKIPLSTPLFAQSYEHIRWDDFTNIRGQHQQLQNILKAPYMDGLSTTASGTARTNDPLRNKNKDESLNEVPVHRQCSPLPLIVHNGFMDLLFLMTHFCCTTLPSTFVDAKRVLLNHFPLIYDTKILATECWTEQVSNTNLSNLFQYVAKREQPFLSESNDDSTGTGTSTSLNQIPSTATSSKRLIDMIEVVTSTVRRNDSNTVGEETSPEQEDQEHEAAFDAFMTGVIFIGLCQLIWNDIKQGKISSSLLSSSSGSDALSDRHTFLDTILSDDGGSNEEDYLIPRHFTGRNKLYQMSLFTLDLELRNDNDPLSKGMSRQSTFRVAGFDKSIKTSDIVRCLSGLQDSVGRQVNFEVLWIDDTTFLAAAVYRDGDNNNRNGRGNTDQNVVLSNDAQQLLLQEHGKVMCRALETKFNKNQESIVTLDEYLNEIYAKSSTVEEHHCEEQTKSNNNNVSWMRGVLSFLGIHGSDDTHHSEEPQRKRRRMSEHK